MPKKTIIGRLKDVKALLSLVMAIGAVFVWFETTVVKTDDLRRVEIASREDDITLLLLPYGGSIEGAPPEVVATFNIWIKELARKREG